MKSVVVFDPNGLLPVGELLDGDKVGAARRRSVAMLPADDHMYFNGLPGFTYRPWGTGVHFDDMMPRRDCPMLVAVHPQTPQVYWAMQLRPIRANEPMTGRVRVVGNAAAGAMAAGMTQDVPMPLLEGIDQKNVEAVVITGRNSVSVNQEGMFGLSLHGVCRNVRVVWSCASVAAELVETQRVVSV